MRRESNSSPSRLPFRSVCMPAELILEETTASSSPKAIHASPSSLPISPQRRRDTLVCLTYVFFFVFFGLLPSPVEARTHNAGARVRACARSVFVVRRRECVPDFCRDATHVYPRTPARATARRSDPRSRKGRPRSCAAREQYVPRHTYHSLLRRQSLFSLTFSTLC